MTTTTTTKNKINKKLNAHFHIVDVNHLHKGVYYWYKIPFKSIRLSFYANLKDGVNENIMVDANVAGHRFIESYDNLNDAINACFAYDVTDGIVLEK